MNTSLHRELIVQFRYIVLYYNYIRNVTIYIYAYKPSTQSRATPSQSTTSLPRATREVQLGIRRAALARFTLVRRQRGKKVKRGAQKMQKKFGPGEGREFISETTFDFPGRNPFEELRPPAAAPLVCRLPLTHKHE